MRDQGQRPRLKGLDEMPTPRRTLRQHYFWLRARVLESKYFWWVWPLLKLAVWVAVIWLVARLLGFPIERLARRLLPRLW